jgi:hypothetical protein
MEFVYVTPSKPTKGNHSSIAKARAARLGVEKRRQARERLITDILEGRALPCDRTLVIWPSGKKHRPPKPEVGYRKTNSQKDWHSVDVENVEETGIVEWASPANIIGRGSSDPFNAAAVVIDATANDLMRFSRECFVPWIDSLEGGEKKIQSYRNKFVLTPIESLHHGANAHANLAMLSVVLARVTNNAAMRVYAYRLANVAYKALQDALPGSQSLDDEVPLRILSLLAFEIMANDPAAAALHARALQLKFTECRMRKEKIDPTYLNAALFHDTNRSIMFLERPIIDASLLSDQNIPGHPQRVCDALQKRGLCRPTPLNGFVETALPVEVCLLLEQYRQLLLLHEVCRMHETSSNFNGISDEWMQSLKILGSHILHAFHDARDVLAVETKERQAVAQQAAICLAVVYWGMLFINLNVFTYYLDTFWWRQGPGNLFIASDFLRGAEIEALVDQIDWDKDDAPASLHLWLLYVAMLSEHSKGVILGGDRGYMLRQNIKFVMQAIEMGLREWSDVAHVLEGYFYAPDLGVKAKEWFDRALKELNGRNRPLPKGRAVTFRPGRAKVLNGSDLT